MNEKQLFLLDYEPLFDFITQDSLIVKQRLDNHTDIYEYVIMKERDFHNKETDELRNAIEFPDSYKTAIPIGSIQFVSSFLSIFFGIEKEKPIEIPECLRTMEFLNRAYTIVTADKLPSSGFYFVKDVSDQKSFSFLGEIAELHAREDKPISMNHNYAISEVVDITSEYRIYIIRGEIANISFYKGKPDVLPDIEFIKKVLKTYAKDSDAPKSFSFDVMITQYGTFLLEVHTFLSLGLFSTIWPDDLIDAYIDGLEYVVGNRSIKA